MTTVRSLLASHDVPAGDEPRRDAEILLSHLLEKPRAWLYAHSEDEVSDDVVDAFRSLSQRRAEGVPIAYLIGHREFWTLDLTVTPAVLIPRHDTELLVESALRHIPQRSQCRIVDLGTGSGAIALSLARERPNSCVVATDVTAEILSVAKANAERLGIGNVEFICGDWFSALGNVSFDAIVSNPPYIASDDAHLSQGDLRFEPREALVSGIDGLDSIRQIVRGAPQHLKPGGWLLIEHGFDQGGAVRQLFAECGFVDIYTSRDVEKRERVTAGVKPL